MGVEGEGYFKKQMLGLIDPFSMRTIKCEIVVFTLFGEGGGGGVETLYRISVDTLKLSKFYRETHNVLFTEVDHDLF